MKANSMSVFQKTWLTQRKMVGFEAHAPCAIFLKRRFKTEGTVYSLLL